MFRIILVLGLGLFVAWAVDATRAEVMIIIMLVEIVFPDINFKENGNGDNT